MVGTKSNPVQSVYIFTSKQHGTTRQHKRTQVTGAIEHVLPCQNGYELAAFPAASIIIVSLFLPDTTNSLL
jgi:hypothetical protein